MDGPSRWRPPRRAGHARHVRRPIQIPGVSARMRAASCRLSSSPHHAAATALSFSARNSAHVNCRSVASASYLVLEARVEHLRIVGVDRDQHTGVEQGADRVRGKRRHHAGAHVGDRAHLERDPALQEQRDEGRVLHCPRSVPDPIDRENPHRAPHALGPGSLAGVGAGPEPAFPGLAIHCLVRLRRKRLLRPSDADPDDAEVLDLVDLAQPAQPLLGTEIPDQIGDEVDLDPILVSRQAFPDRLRQALRLKPVVLEIAG